MGKSIVTAEALESMHVKIQADQLPKESAVTIDAPTVTVAVVSYNNEDTIVAAMESAVYQTLAGVEVIVVDDCSTDRTPEIVRTFAVDHPQIRFYSTETNTGSASGPRNIAIERAAGRYITFLDGDDELDRNACYNWYWPAEERRAEIVTGHVRRRQVDTGKITEWHRWLYKEAAWLETADELPDLVYDSTSTAKIYRLDFLRRNNLKFTEGVYFEDNEFASRAYSLARGIYLIPDPVYIWNVYPVEERLTVTANWKNVASHRDRITAFEKGFAYFESQGMDHIRHKLVQKTLKHDIWLFIDSAYRAHDFMSMLQLWSEATRVLPYVEDEDLDEVPLRIRCKIATLLAGDLEAFNDADSISPKNMNMRGSVKQGHWIPEGWTLEYARDPRWAKYTELRTDPAGALLMPKQRAFSTPAEAKWRHVMTGISNQTDHVEIFGRTSGLHNAFSREEPITVRIRVTRDGGGEAISYDCGTAAWDGDSIIWTGRLARVCELTWLRNATWSVDLILVQGARSARDHIYTSKSFKPVHYNYRARSQGPSWISSLMVTKRKDQSLYVRRTPAVGASGIFYRAMSTMARLRRFLINRRLRGLNTDAQLHAISAIARRLPVKKGLYVFESHMGKQYSDGPRAISEALGQLHPKAKLYWSFQNRGYSGEHVGRAVVRHTHRYAYLLGRAQLVVDNQGFPGYFRRRSGQLYLNTWHGVPLKRMGTDSDLKRNSPEIHEIERSVSNWSVTQSPSTYYLEHLVRAMTFTGPVLESNLARNDCLIGYEQNDRIEALVYLGLPTDRRYVLYAPTFRQTNASDKMPIEVMIDIEQWVREIPNDVVLLVRSHYLNRVNIPSKYRSRVVDVGFVDEASRLYQAADMMITDYSSVMFDYALTGKPIVIFAPDYEEYASVERGVNFDIRKLAPGAYTEELDALYAAVIDALENGASPGTAEKYRNFVEQFCGLQPANGVDTAVKYIEEHV